MAELPRGTVTLLFTDIEGSTRLLQELGEEAYVRALEDHRRLLREAFTAHGGVEVEMQGDSFHFAFTDPCEAVLAAAQAQRALAEHAWERRADPGADRHPHRRAARHRPPVRGPRRPSRRTRHERRPRRPGARLRADGVLSFAPSFQTVCRCAISASTG